MSEKGRNTVNHILYTVIQWSWGIVQNCMACLLLLFLFVTGKIKRTGYYHGAVMVDWDKSSSMGLGMFIFFGHHMQESTYAKKVKVHEYGHTIQSCILGPLFLPVIGIPSFVWAFFPAFRKMRKEKGYSYFDFYPEAWANYEGERVLHRKSPGNSRGDQQR